MEELRALATNVDIGWTLVGAALVLFHAGRICDVLKRG